MTVTVLLIPDMRLTWAFEAMCDACPRCSHTKWITSRYCPKCQREVSVRPEIKNRSGK